MLDENDDRYREEPWANRTAVRAMLADRDKYRCSNCLWWSGRCIHPDGERDNDGGGVCWYWEER